MNNTQNPYLGDPNKINIRGKIRELLTKRKDPNYVKAYLYEVEGLDMDTINTEVDSILTLSGQTPTTQPTQKPGMVDIGGQQMELKTMSDVKAYNEMKQAESAKKEQTDSALSSFTEKLGFADDILSDTQGLKSTAGAVQFQMPWSKTKQRFIGNVEGLLDVESIDALIEAKKQGATFGSLTDRELQMLRSTASKIGKWAVTDPETEKVIGYDIDEETLQKELTRLRDGFKTAKEKIEASRVQETPEATQVTQEPEDDYSYAQTWLQQNPNDPRAEKVKQYLENNRPVQTQEMTQDIPEETTQEKKTLIGEIGETLKDRFSNIFNIVQGKRVKTGEDINTIFHEKALQTIGQLATIPFDIIGDVFEVSYDKLPQEDKAKIEQGLKTLAETEAGKKGLEALGQGVEAYNEWATKNPRLAQNVEGVVNVVGSLTGTKAGQLLTKPIVGMAERTVKGTTEAVGDLAKGAVETGNKVVSGAKNIGTEIAEKSPNALEYGISQTYGFSPETIKTIIKNPEAFSKEEMESITRESVFGKANQKVSQMMEDLSDTGKAYDPIRKSGNYTTISKEFIPEMIKKYGFKVENGKVIATTKSLTRENADINALQNFLDNWGDKTVLGADEFLNMRKDLTELAKFGSISGKTGASETVAKGIRNELNTRYRGEIEGLTELDNTFAKQISELDKVKGIIFDKKGNIKPNAISTIANLTGKGKEQQLKELKKIIPDIEEQVNILKAVEDVKLVQGQKVGTYLRGTAGIGVGLGVGGPVGAIIGAIVTSPQFGLKILRAYGAKKNLGMVEGIITKMKNGTELVEKEKKIVGEAIDDAVETANKRVGEATGAIEVKDLKGKGEILPTTTKEAKE